MVTSKGRTEDVVPLRLLELRDPDGPLPTLSVARPVSVLALDDGTRIDEVARRLSDAILGPRPPGTDGVVDAGGKRGRLVDVPTELLDGIDSLVLDDLARAAARRRAGASLRAELELRSTALADAVLAIRGEAERARARLDEVDGRIQQLRASLEDANESDLDPRDHVAERIRNLLDQLEIAAAQPLLTDPDALALAAEWDALLATRTAPSDTPPLDEAHGRVERARAALRHLEGDRLTSGKVRELHELARRVAEAEHALDGAKRSERTAAATRVEQARRAEAKALAALGFSSRAGFLVAIADGVPDGAADDEARRAAAEELATAEAELERAREAAERPSAAQLAERELELRARAAQLLNHFPGDDVASELRALRREPPIVGERRAALRDALVEHGVDPAPDPARVATAWLRDHAAARAGAAAEAAEAAARRDEAERELQARRGERERIARELEQLGLRLEAMELERDAARRAHDAAGPDDLAIEEPDEAELEAALREEARRVLDQADSVQLPLVVGSLLGILGEGARARALRLLEDLSAETQIIVVAADPAVLQWAETLGDLAEVTDATVARPRPTTEPRAATAAAPVATAPTPASATGAVLDDSVLPKRGRFRFGRRAKTTAETHATAPAPPVVRAPVDEVRRDQRVEPPDPDEQHEAHDVRTSSPPIPAPSATATATEDAPRSPGAALLAGAIAAELELARLSGDDSVVERLSRQVGARAQFYDPGVPLAACDGHPNIPTRLRCGRCRIPCCDLCSVVLGEPLELLCLDCALVASGARVRRHRRRGSLPRL